MGNVGSVVFLTKMRMDFDALATTWDAEHGPSSARAVEFAACLAILRGTCQRFRRPRVLDVGCGTGLHLLGLADHISEGVGVDLSAAMVEQARKKAKWVDARLRFTMASAEELSTEALGWFDLVFLVGSLEHMLDPARVLTRVSVVLALGGEVVVIMRNPLHPSTLFRRLTGRSKVLPRYRHMTPRELVNVAERSGLKLVRLMSVVATSQDLRAGDVAATSWHSALGVQWHRIYAAHLVRREARTLAESATASAGGVRMETGGEKQRGQREKFVRMRSNLPEIARCARSVRPIRCRSRRRTGHDFPIRPVSLSLEAIPEVIWGMSGKISAPEVTTWRCEKPSNTGL